MCENRTVAVKVSLKDNVPDAIRYAAYAVSDAAYVFIKPARGGVTVEFTLKSGPRAAGRAARDETPARAAKNLLKRFKEELKDEKLRAAISDSNRDLREFMVLKALSYVEPPAGYRQEDSGLTPEEEKELDALIAQVEREIKKESAGRTAKDPLGITSTWEEKYGAKNGRKKN